MKEKASQKTDFSTGIGLVAGFALVFVAIVLGGDPDAFLNLRAALIVVGGTMAVTIISFSFEETFEAASASLGALSVRTERIQDTAERMVTMAEIGRKEGLRGVEKRLKEFRNNAFLSRALTLAVDGTKPDDLEQLLEAEVESLRNGRAKSANVLRRAAEVAPAMGLIGTLVGLVQMLTRLDDPGTIGPAMAVALITTLYGAMLGNMVFAPLASKLERNSQAESLRLAVYAASVAAIGRQENPRRLQTAINAMLPSDEQIRVYS